MKVVDVTDLEYIRRQLRQIDHDLATIIAKSKEAPEPKPSFIDPLAEEGLELNSD